MFALLNPRNPDDRMAIVTLWQEAFGDPIEEIAMFLKFLPPNVDIPALVDEDFSLLSMMFLLPCSLSRSGSDGKPLRARNIFAFCTAEKERGHQCATRLLIGTVNAVKREKEFDAFVLYPATPSLVEFYKRRGFSPCFTRKREEANECHMTWDRRIQKLIDTVYPPPHEVPEDPQPGMLYPLTPEAEDFLARSQGRAYMPYALD